MSIAIAMPIEIRIEKTFYNILNLWKSQGASSSDEGSSQEQSSEGMQTPHPAFDWLSSYPLLSAKIKNFSLQLKRRLSEYLLKLLASALQNDPNARVELIRLLSHENALSPVEHNALMVSLTLSAQKITAAENILGHVISAAPEKHARHCRDLIAKVSPDNTLITKLTKGNEHHLELQNENTMTPTPFRTTPRPPGYIG